MIRFEYGAISSRYSLEAENKLTSYATMIVHFNTSSHLVALYEPKEIIKNDSWLNPFGQISERLDEIFGGSFDKYVNEHIEEIKKCYATIIELL